MGKMDETAYPVLEEKTNCKGLAMFSWKIAFITHSFSTV